MRPSWATRFRNGATEAGRGEVGRAGAGRTHRPAIVPVIACRRVLALDSVHAIALQLTYKGGEAVEDQVTVRLPADLGQALRRASRRLRRKNSDIVRLALQEFLQVGE